MKKIKLFSGFTLIEIMASLFILMIVGIMTSTGLNFIARSNERIEARAAMMGNIQSAFMTIENDLRQLRPESSFIPDGPRQPGLTLADSWLQLTCSDFMTDLKDASRGATKTITYQLINNTLVRFTRKLSFKASDSTITFQTLLSGVNTFHYTMIPPINPLTHPSEPLLYQKTVPTGILIDIELTDYGHIKRIIPLAINTTDPEPHAAIPFS